MNMIHCIYVLRIYDISLALPSPHGKVLCVLGCVYDHTSYVGIPQCWHRRGTIIISCSHRMIVSMKSPLCFVPFFVLPPPAKIMTERERE